MDRVESDKERTLVVKVFDNHFNLLGVRTITAPTKDKVVLVKTCDTEISPTGDLEEIHLSGWRG